jgi:hypothetical protein
VRRSKNARNENRFKITAKTFENPSGTVKKKQHQNTGLIIYLLGRLAVAKRSVEAS